MTEWTTVETQHADLKTGPLNIHITEQLNGRATWFVWIAESNMASLSGSSDSMGLAKVESVDAIRTLLSAALSVLEGLTGHTTTLVCPISLHEMLERYMRLKMGDGDDMSDTLETIGDVASEIAKDLDPDNEATLLCV